MAQLKGFEVYKWSVIRAIAPDYALTLVFIFVPLHFEKWLEELLGDPSWSRSITFSVQCVGMSYFVMIALSLFIGWENVLTRRTHKRVERALRQGRNDSEP